MNQSDIFKKLKIMNSFQSSFEESVHRAQRRLQYRYFVVKEQLQGIYERQCAELNEELRQFHAEKEWLKNLQVVQKNARLMLTKPYSSSFVPESETLLIELKKSNKKGHHALQIPTFVKPPNKPDIFSREFQLLCCNVILGYITYDTIEEIISFKPHHPGKDISKCYPTS